MDNSPQGSSADQPATGARPRLLVALAVALIPAFAITTAITRAYRAEQRRLATEWFERGTAALDANQPAHAVEALRTALMFSRDDRLFRLRLAQALAAQGRTTEARAYLLTLRDAQPGNGPVNLELARLAARRGTTDEAHQYYHAAIEGAWSDTAEAQRRAIRLELAKLLIERGSTLPAQAELIVLADDLPPDPALQHRVAELMLDAGLPSRAQRIYEQQLQTNPRDPRALAGAGRAAFETGNFIAAESLLAKAASAGASGETVTSALATARLIGRLDPFRRRLALRTRAARALEALKIAEARLTACTTERPDAAMTELAERIEPIRSRLARPASRDLDTIDEAMEVVFQIEEATASLCGEPEGGDLALLLLGRQRAGGGI